MARRRLSRAELERRIEACRRDYEAAKAALAEVGFTCEGSLVTRYRSCGNPNCRCVDPDQRHGPYYVLSTRSGGQGSFSYLDAPTARDARARVARYRAFRHGLKGLQRVNGALVELLRRYQRAQLRKTVRRLGLPAAKNP